MGGFVRVLVAGGVGAFVGEWAGPKINDALKPESNFARQAMKFGVAAASTAASWYVLGAVPALAK